MSQNLKKRTTVLSMVIALLCITSAVKAQTGVYHALVAKDGSGQYQTVQEAIDAAPEYSKSPWLIFIKNGSYDEQVFVPKTKPFIHLIGQDKEKTVIHHNMNVGGAPAENATPETIKYWETSVHNPQAKVYKKQGSVVSINGSDFYSENISYINDYGIEYLNGPQALAMKSHADRASFNNCIFRSFQDTWMTSTKDSDRHYVKDCFIEGAVDYLYGGGDVLLENCTFYNNRSGSVIVAPCHENAKYGYIIRNCIVDGNAAAADGRQLLGRPWHNSPKTVYINTTMRIPIAPEGWTNMGTIPGLFAEYNSQDANGNVLDLSQRKTEYQKPDKTKGTSRTSVTKEEADSFVYENIIPGNDQWNPRLMMVKLPAPDKLEIKKQKIQWKEVSGAIGYLISQGDQIIGMTKELSCDLPQNNSGTIQVYPINAYGSLGNFREIRNRK